MKWLAKSVIESVALNTIWLEPSENNNNVKKFIEKIRPKVTKTPLKRFGGPNDGGYLLPDDFEGITTCISPGVSDEISFDSDLANLGIDVFMADASVDGPPLQNEKFHFEKKFLDVYDSETTVRLDTICANIPESLAGDRILQMDIEGAEYQVLLDTSYQTLKSFRIIAIEFHNLPSLFSRFGFTLITATFEKLLRHHHIVHIHPNNVAGCVKKGDIQIPRFLEVTFYRKDHANVDPNSIATLPHPLDADTIPDKSSIELAECWQAKHKS